MPQTKSLEMKRRREIVRGRSALKSTLCLGLCTDLQTSCFLVHEIIRTESEGIPPGLTCSGREGLGF